MIVNRNIPVEFTVKNTYEVADTRFVEVTIKLMHTEENYNGSFFSKDVIESAIPSLANTPILAYIEENSNGEIDYSDHRQILVKEDGNYKIKYIGQAIGVIPETNNARFEKYTTESNIEREYLVVDGLLWTKWDEPVDIIQRDEKHQQSMEIHKNYQGRFEDDNLFHFTYFQFFGACALSNIDVLPAMEEASIELKYTLENFQEEIQLKMEQFKQFTLKNQSLLGVDDINNIKEVNIKLDEKIELLKKYNLTKENLSFSIEHISLEDLENKIKEQFSLSNNQLITEITKLLEETTEIRNDYWGDPYQCQLYYLVDIKDNYAIVIASDWTTYYGITYTVNGDIVSLDMETKIEFIPDWRQKQEGDTANFSIKNIVEKEFSTIKNKADNKINEITEKFTTANTEKETQISELQVKLDTTTNDFNKITKEFDLVKPEIERLKEFEKSTISTQRKEAEDTLFSQFEQLNDNEQFQELKKNASQFSLDQLEKEIAFIVVKSGSNIKFTAKSNKKQTVKLNVNHDHDEENGNKVYGDLFEKYLPKRD